MKRLLLVVGLFTLLHWLHAAEDPGKTEYEKFAGTWRFTAMEFEGKKEPEKNLEQMCLILQGEKFTVKAGTFTFKGTFKVDVSKKPKQIDVTYSEGPQKGESTKGIYELEGDTYKVCMALPGKERPTTFESKPGSGHVLQVLTREKAADKESAKKKK